MGKYSGLAPEEIDTADTLEEATTLLGEYRMAFGGNWELWIEALTRSNPFCQCRNNPRIVQHDYSSSGRSKPQRCRVCGAATREGKEFCSLHIDQAGYVQGLSARISQLEEEEARAEEGEVDLSPRSEIAKELLLLLETNGPKTIERLAIDLNKSKKVVQTFVEGLQKKGLLKTKLTKRGATMVSLQDQ